MAQRSKLYCATGNIQKFTLAKIAFDNEGIDLEQVVIKVDEIQGEDPGVIIADKARKAFAILSHPLLVSDDSWSIPALNGFPGAYMKSVNHWFEPVDFINLMKDKADRTVYFDQRLVYVDKNDIVTFNQRSKGIIAEKPKGETGPPIMRVVELEDDGMTIAESFDTGLINQKDARCYVWKEAAEWFASHRVK